MFEAVQEPSEPIKNFAFRLQMLAYKCNFTTSCSNKNCTAANYGGNILLAMVRGLANDAIKEEILSRLYQISMEDAKMIISKRESEKRETADATMLIQTVDFSNTLEKSLRGLKIITQDHMNQRGATQLSVRPNKAPTKHEETNIRSNGAVRPRAP